MFFKFHQNHTISEEFDFWRVNGKGDPISKIRKKPCTEQWSQPTPKISALQLNQKVFKNQGEQKFEKKEDIHRSNFGDFQSAIKTSIINILISGFLQYVCVCLPKRQKYSTDIYIKGNKVNKDQVGDCYCDLSTNHQE